MKNLRILYILFVVCTVLYFVVQKPSIFVSEKKFSYASQDEIDLITIAKGTIKTELKKDENGTWLANGEVVNEEIIDNLVYALSHQQVDFPVPINSTNRAIEKLANEGFEVKVFSKKSKKLEFTICNIDTVCVALVKNKKQPYILSIPGYNEKTTNYISANASFYFNNTVLKYLPTEIVSIAVENIENPEESFAIFQTAGNNLMLFDTKNQNFIPSDENKMRTYFSYFNGVEYDKILNLTNSEYRKIAARKPTYRLTLKTKDDIVSLTIIKILLNKPVERYGQLQTIDTDNFHLLINDNQSIVTAKWVNFDILLKKMSDFVDK